jgi:hypothetical protein
MWRNSFLVLLVLAVPCLAQTDKAGTASVSGRITRGDQSVFRMLVTAQPANQFSGWQQPQWAVRTGSNGQYRLTGLKAGSYLITPHVLTDVLVSEGKPFVRGKTVLVKDGEDVEGVDFTVIPGGIITGTITDEFGQPAVGVEVTLLQYLARERSGERTPYDAPCLRSIAPMIAACIASSACRRANIWWALGISNSRLAPFISPQRITPSGAMKVRPKSSKWRQAAKSAALI